MESPTDLTSLPAGCEIDDSRLAAAGFTCERSGQYVRAETLAAPHLIVTARVDPTARTCALSVTDAELGEPYLLHRVAGAQGTLVGTVRAACERLRRLALEQACPRGPTVADQRARLTEFMRAEFGCAPEFLWADLPDCAAVRRPDNRKWFAVLMRVPAARLGLPEGAPAEIVNLRMLKDEKPRLVDKLRAYPAYHMNKNTWFSALLGHAAPWDWLCERVRRSYALAASPPRPPRPGTRREPPRDGRPDGRGRGRPALAGDLRPLRHRHRDLL